jgi:DNA-binding response OmpR family regulator
MHALIIEDEPLAALVLADILAELGFDSYEIAVSEERAIAAAKARCPDLITADVGLAAGGSGLAAVRAICSERPILVIYITGTRAELAEAPAALIVDKPFADHSVKTAVNLALSGFQRTQG